MSATTVQLAIQQFFQSQSIPGLNVIYRAPVMVADPSKTLPNGVSAGATSFVWLESQIETVISTGLPPNNQPNGWRMVDYNAALIFDYYVLKTATSDDSWIDGLNNMTAGIQTSLRAAPNLNNPNVIFTAANEFPLPDASISVILGEPLPMEGTQSFLVHGAVVFPVHEQVPPA